MKISRWLLICLSMLALICAACGTNTTTTGTTPTAASAPTKGVNVPPQLDDSSVSAMIRATQKGDFHTPLDSTPDMTGKTIYFTASNTHGAGVFQVPADGGTATEVFVGSPFMSPRGIAISPDGQTLYIADPKADQIFALAIAGKMPVSLAGSKGTNPQNLNVVNQNGLQVVYFTGKDATSGQAAVLTLPAKGSGSATVVAKGTPLVAPDGIVVKHDGTIYVSDRMAGGANEGKIFKIMGSAVSPIVNQVHLGNPAGIALSPDESILLASALQNTNNHDQVVLVDLKSLSTGAVTKVVGQNINDAGGLHASPGVKSVLSWCGVTVGDRGTVFQVTLK